MALIAGEAVNEIKSLDDAEIVECCLQKLRIMFPDQVSLRFCMLSLRTRGLYTFSPRWHQHIFQFSQFYVVPLFVYLPFADHKNP